MNAPQGGGAKEQLARLLTLVPYLNDRGEMSVVDAAQALGVSPDQVVRDLRVLFMVGLPGGYPDDLIDVDLDALSDSRGGTIRVTNAGYLSRPVRLTSVEASALLVALSAMEQHASASAREVIGRVRAKLQLAAAGDDSGAIATHDPADAAGNAARVAELRRELEQLLQRQTQAEIRYWVPSRDRADVRTISPQRLVPPTEGSSGHWYLSAWCHQAEGARLFRLDRIQSLTPLETPVAADEMGEVEQESAAQLVTLRLASEAQWVAEYFDLVAVRELEVADIEVDLMVYDVRWVLQLVRRLSPHARVVVPEEFAHLSAEEARGILSLYQGGA